MPNDYKEDLIKYRIQMAEEKLLSSKLLLEGGKYKDSISRSYYSIFSAIRAVLSFKGQDFKKHSAIISVFRKEYIKTGIFDKRYSDIIGAAFDDRNRSDYDEFFMFFKEDAINQYNNAKEFLGVVKEYIKRRLEKEGYNKFFMSNV